MKCEMRGKQGQTEECQRWDGNRMGSNWRRYSGEGVEQNGLCWRSIGDLVSDTRPIWPVHGGQCALWGARQDCNGQEWAGKGWAGCTRVVMPLLCLSLGAQGQALVLQGIRCCWVIVCCSVGVIQ